MIARSLCVLIASIRQSKDNCANFTTSESVEILLRAEMESQYKVNLLHKTETIEKAGVIIHLPAISVCVCDWAYIK